MMEALVGGMRYEMVELPDSLVDTTVFVGNLCEFVSDEDLSSLFQQVSSLNFLPACVARKPNSSSMCYGFVTFPTIQEKESAIIRFSGYVLNDKAIRVEPIIDYKFRVRVPEKLVSYSLGPAKQLRGGGRNTLRQVSENSSREGGMNQKCSHDKSWRKKKCNRSGRDSRMKSNKTHASFSSTRDKDREKRFRRKQQRHRDQLDMGEL
jgi:RNA recognition motif-containing protein